jgi:phytoene synthase
MAPLLGCDEREDMAALGVAFQLTNFIRDVREDWTLDRVYLPGLPEADLARGEAGDGAREGSPPRFARARALFARTGDLPERCERTMPPGDAHGRAVYERVLDRVERSGFDVVRAGADLPALEGRPRGRRRAARMTVPATARGAHAPRSTASRADVSSAARRSPVWPSRASSRAAAPTS